MAKEFSSNLALLFLRLAIGGQIAWLHGYDKFHHFSSRMAAFPDPTGMGQRQALGLAVAGELVGGALLVLGFASRPAAFLLTATLGLTFYATYPGMPWHERQTWLLYGVGALAILLLGSGKFALDSVVWKRFRKGGGKASAKTALAAARR